MDRLHKKLILFSSFIILISACSSSKTNQFVEESMPVLGYNNIAMDLTIRGSIQEVLGNDEHALRLYQEAKRYDSTSAGIDLAIAKIQQNLGEYEKAMLTLEEGMQKDSTNFEILDNLAILKEIKQEDDFVIRLYQKMINLRPDDYAIKNRLARIYERTGKDGAAIQLYEEIVKLENVKPEIWQSLGNLYLKRGDKKNAIRCFKNLISTFPGNETTYLRLGKYFQQAGDTLEAVKLYIDAIESKIRFNHVVQELADIYVAQHKTDQAISLFETYYQGDTTSFFRITSLAEAHEKYGDTDRAQILYHRLTELYSDNWRAWVQTGRFEQRQHRYDNSLKYFKVAGSLTNDGLPSLLLSQNYLQVDSLGAAEQTLRTIYPKNMDNIDVNYLLGLAVKKQNRAREAIPFFKTVLKVKPSDANAALMLAESYAQIRHFEKSDSLYQFVIANSPEKALFQNNFSYSLAQRGEKLDYALDLVDDALKQEPENGAYLDTKGWVLFKMGKYEESLKYIQNSLQTRGKNVEVLEHLGDVYSKLGDRNKAVEAWKEAYSLDKSRESLYLKINLFKE